MSYRIELNTVDDEWIRMRGRYPTRKMARGWVSFVRARYHGLPARVVRVDDSPHLFHAPASPPLAAEGEVSTVVTGGGR